MILGQRNFQREEKQINEGEEEAYAIYRATSKTVVEMGNESRFYRRRFRQRIISVPGQKKCLNFEQRQWAYWSDPHSLFAKNMTDPVLFRFSGKYLANYFFWDKYVILFSK